MLQFLLWLTKFSQTPKSQRWHLNVSLIERQDIPLNDKKLNFAVWWDTLKAYLRGRIISYASFEKFTELESKLKTYLKSHSLKPRINKRITTKYQLNKWYHKEAEDALFWTNQTYITGKWVKSWLKACNCDFYRTFEDIISHLLLEVLNGVFQADTY